MELESLGMSGKMSKPEHNDENIQLLAQEVVTYWDQDTITDYVTETLKEEYNSSKDRFNEDWELFVEDMNKDD